MYRPNNRVDFQPFFDILSNVSVAYCNVIVAGDFNSNILTDEYLTNNMLALGLRPTNTYSPTHFTNYSNTLLDLFFVNDLKRTLLYDQISAPCFSKHDFIYLTFDFATEMTELNLKTYTFKNFKAIDYETLSERFNSVNWDRILYMPSADDQIQFLQDSLNRLYSTCVPEKIVRAKKDTMPWFNVGVNSLIDERNRIYNRWKRYKIPDDYLKFKTLRSKITRTIRKLKKDYFEQKFKNATNSKQKWACIREIGINNHSRNVLNENLNVEQLNLTFANLSSEADPVQSDLLDINQLSFTNDNNFSFTNVSQSDVFKSISCIKSNAVGLDLICPRFLKLLLPYLLSHLTHIFNTILTTSEFPLTWKSAKVLPIPKSGNELRPICILPMISKAFEKILCLQITNYIEKHKLLSKYQSGFREKHSCLSALIYVCEEIRSAIDNNEVSFLGLLDFSKAFLNVDHNIMLRKLFSDYKFSRSSLKLLQSYLSNRQQAVFYNGKLSSFLNINKGVPQGSIMGPLLFTLYINDLPKYLNRAKVHLYADDVQIYLNCDKTVIDNCAIEFNSELCAIKNWADSNTLVLNPSKCKCLVISKRSTEVSSVPEILIGNETVPKVESAKNLGIVFNKTLTFEHHIRSSIGKVYGMLRCLWISRAYTPKDTRMLLAKSYLIPTLLYGCELYVNMDSVSRQKMTKIFNNIIRYVFNLKRFDSTSAYSGQLFNMSLDNLLNYKSLLFLHKIIYSGQPEYLYEHVHFMQSTRTKQIKPIRYRSLVSERHFFVNTIRLWNALPLQLQNVRSVPCFKKQLSLKLS